MEANQTTKDKLPKDEMIQALDFMESTNSFEVTLRQYILQAKTTKELYDVLGFLTINDVLVGDNDPKEAVFSRYKKGIIEIINRKIKNLQTTDKKKGLSVVK